MTLLQIVDASNAILWDADDSTGLNNPYGLKTCAWAIDKGRTPTGLDMARPVSGSGAIKVQDRPDAKVMSWVQGYTGITSNNPEDIRRAFGVLSQLLSVSTDESGYRIRYRPGDSMEVRYVEYLGTEFLPNLERGQSGEVRKLYDQLMDPDGQVVEVWRQPFDLGEILDSDVNKAQNSLFLAQGTLQAPLLWTWDSTTSITNGAPDAQTERFKVTLATTGTRNLQFTTAAASAAASQQWLAKLWKIRASAAGVVRARVMIEFLSSTSVVLDSALGSLTSVGTTEMELPFVSSLTAPTNTDRVRVSVQFQNSASTSVDVYMTEIQLEKGQVSTNPTFARTSIAFTQNGLQVASGVPRYEAGKYGGAIMVEEGTTNLLTSAMSTDFSAGWTLDGITVGNNVTAAPDGTSNADRLIETAANSNHRAYSAALLTLAAAGTNSFYLKAAERNFAYVAVGGSQVAVFDLSLGTITSSAPDVTASIVPVPNAPGWYRCSVATGNVVAGGEVQVGVLNASVAYNASKAYAGDITKGIYVWHAQGELKAYPTSWQIGGTARNAETLTIPTAGILSGTVGTVEHWVSPQRAAGTNLEYLFDGGGGANANLEVWIGTDGKLNLKYGTGSSTVTLTSASALTQNTFTHVAWRWSSAGVALLINGVSVGSSATAPGIVFGANAFLGSNQSSALQGDSLLDDWRASSVARTDAQILATATSSSPAPEDSSTTYKLEFDSDLGVDLTDAPSMYRTGTETVSMNPASTSAFGRVVPIQVMGDADAVIQTYFTGAYNQVLVSELRDEGNLVHYINTRKYLQGEAGTLGTDTAIVASAGDSGGAFARTTFVTTAMTTRLTFPITSLLAAFAGRTLKVYGRLARNSADATVRMQWGLNSAGSSLTTEASAPVGAGGFKEIYFGDICIPENAEAMYLAFQASGNSGGPSLDWDHFTFMSVDDGFATLADSTFTPGSTDSMFTDPEGSPIAVVVSSAGAVKKLLDSAYGDPPLLAAPGLVAVHAQFINTGGVPSSSNSATATLRTVYPPRYRI